MKKNLNKSRQLKRIIIIMIMAFCANVSFIYAQDKTNDDFKPSGNLWGMCFGDYYYKTHADSLGRGAGNIQYRGITPNSTNGTNPNGQMDAFQMRRAYIGYDYNISKKFSAYAVLAYESGPNNTGNANGSGVFPNSNLGFPGTNLDAGGNNTIYLKYLYMKWANIFKGSNLLIGQMSTPSFATSFNTDPLWSYRSSERTIMDMHNIDGSSDMGVALQGNFWKQKNAKDSLKPSLIGYQIMVGNGASAKPETDRFKKWRGTLYTSLMQQKLTIGVYGDYNTVQLSPYLLTNTTFKGYVHFKTNWFRIGAEAFQQTNKNSDIYYSTPTAKADTAAGCQFGWSVFGSTKIIKDKLSFFIRMDKYNPDNKFSSSNYYYKASDQGGSSSVGNGYTTTFYKQTFYNIGFDYTPFGRIHIMPNLWYNSYKTMANSYKGATINGSNAKSGYDMVARITIYYVFNSSKSISGNGMSN